VELRHLRYFVALADELHFGRAAHRLHIVQPALSKQIAALERELGVQLFVRTKRSVSITDAGRVLAPEARSILKRVERAIETTKLTAQGDIGRLEIGCIAPATWSVLPAALRSFSRQVPGVKLRLTELPSASQLEALHAGTIDVGFVRLPLYDETLQFDVVYREPFIATVPEIHPLAAQKDISVLELAEEPFIAATRSAEPGFYDQCIAVFAEHGVVPRIVEEGNAPSAMLGMIAMGLGVTVSPASLLTMPRVGVVCRPLRKSSVVLELGVARHPEVGSPALEAFLLAVGEVAAAMERYPTSLNGVAPRKRRAADAT
jgi:DNA-binding transcriptional LysR family regulator